MSSQVERNIREDFLRDARTVCRDLCCCCVDNGVFMCCVPTFVLIMQLILFILQTVGTFMKKWVTINNTTGDVNSTSPNITDVDFNQTAVDNLQMAAFGILLIILVVIVVAGIRQLIGKNVDSDAMKRLCFILIVPAANFASGVLGFISCMMVASSEYEKGVSFYICLPVSLIQMVLIFLCCGLHINLRNDCLGIRKDGKAYQTSAVGSEECN